MSSSGRRSIWTQERDTQLCLLRRNGLPWSAIALRLGCDATTCSYRYDRLQREGRAARLVPGDASLWEIWCRAEARVSARRAG